jgi:murein DD-endopeptidase MepM/ murein hydrolase activator NlpD
MRRSMNRWFPISRRGLGVACAALLLLGLFQEPVAAVNARSLRVRQRALQNQQWQLNQRLSQQRARAAALKAKEAHAVRELSALQQKLEQTATELQDSQYRLKKAEQNLTLTQQKLRMARRSLKGQQITAGMRLRSIYKHKSLDQWEALLTSPDMGTFLTRYHFFRRISASDAALLERLNRRRVVIHSQQRQFAQQRQTIARVTEQIGTQKVQLTDLSGEQQSLVERIKSERQAAEQAVAQLEADSNQIEAMIRRLMAQRRLIEQRERARNPRYVRPSMGTGRFMWPVAGIITSPFGFRMHPILNRMIGHHGIDFGAGMGTPIYAADDGEVLYGGWYGGYGKVVIIDHGNDVTTLYGHTSSFIVETGRRVRKGQLIAYVGSTGMSTGPHLHFEVRKNGTPINPMGFLGR